MNAKDLRNLANRLIAAGQGESTVLFTDKLFESEAIPVAHVSTDTVNGTVTLSRATVPPYAGLAINYRPAP